MGNYSNHIYEETVFETVVTFWETETGNDGDVKLKVNFERFDEDVKREALAAIDVVVANMKAKIEAA